MNAAVNDRHMDTGNIDIREILPQRPPVLMVDALAEYDGLRAMTEFEVRPECIFVSGGRLTSEGIVENVAQTCAARVGYYSRYVLNLPVEIGYIGAVRKFRIYSNPAVGTTLHTEISVQSEFFGVSMVRAEVTDGNGTVFAEGTVKTAVKREAGE